MGTGLTSTKTPYLHFIGNNASDVTGSCTIIRWKNKKIAVDMGLIQTNNIVVDYKSNKEQVKALKVKDIDAVIITHALHADHSNGLLLGVHNGLKCPIYVPQGTMQILPIMLADSVKIMTQDALKLQHSHGMKASPLADEADIEKVLSLCVEKPFNERYKVIEDVYATNYHAGHIIASSQVLIELKDGYKVKKIAFTGDINTEEKSVSVPPIQQIPYADIVVGEATYSDKSRAYSVKKDRWYDKQLAKTAIEQYNKILIPVFANQRLEDILQFLVDINVTIPVYIDTPLGIKIYNNWIEKLSFEEALDLHFINEWTDSVAIQNKDEHCVILASSGMLTAGRAISHLKTLLPNPNNAVLFCGYSSPNTLASDIKVGARELKVDGEWVKNNAQIYNLKTFSSHANYFQLQDYYTKISCNKICVVHSNFATKVSFCEELQEELCKQGKSTRVVCVSQNQKIYF